MATKDILSVRNIASTISQESFLLSRNFSIIKAEAVVYMRVDMRGFIPLTRPRIIPESEL